MSASANTVVKAISGDGYIDPLYSIPRTSLTVVLIEFECESKRDNWNNPREKNMFTTIQQS